MFSINDDLSIYVTRGDSLYFTVTAQDDGKAYMFQAGDVVRLKVFGKKDAENVVLQKDFPVLSATEKVEIYLTEEETRIGGVISKPTDYWYEVELNPWDNPQTIIGYDEDGAKIFKLFPEGNELPDYVPDPEDIPVVDKALNLTSTRPVQNQAIARAVAKLDAATKDNKAAHAELASEVAANNASVEQEIAVERARVDNLLSGATADDAEVVDIRVGADGITYDSAGTAVREQVKALGNRLHNTPFFARYEEVNGYLNLHHGRITDYADGLGIITDYVPCKTSDVYLYQGATSATSSVASVCWYDEAKNYISGEQYESEDTPVEITVPSEAAFARFCSFKYTQNGAPILKLVRSSEKTFGADARLDNVEAEMKTGMEALQGVTDGLAEGNVLHGKKWVACGDSYTAGNFTGFVDENGLSGKNSPVIYDAEMEMYNGQRQERGDKWIRHLTV